MAENVGEIYFDVDANTGDLIKSSGDVNKATNSMGRNLDKLSKKTDDANKSLGKMSRGAGQAGVQIQQFVGQVQGGQNAMLALSQQAADIGIVLGAPMAGAIAGLAASFGMVLAPALFNSKTAIEQINEAIEKLNKTISISESGVVTFTDRIKSLTKSNASAAVLELESAAIRANEAIKGAGKAISDSFDKKVGFFDSLIVDFNEAAEIVSGGGSEFSSIAEFYRDLGGEFKATGEDAKRLGKDLVRAFAEYKNEIRKGTEESEALVNLRNAFTEIARTQKEARPEITKFVSELSDIFDKADSAQAAIKALSKAKEKLSGGDSSGFIDQEAKDTAKALAAEAAILEERLERGELAAARMAVAFQLGLTNAERLPKPIEDALIKLDELRRKEEKLREDRQKEAQTTRSFESIEKRTVRETESPAQRARRELDERLAVIREYEQLETADLERAQDARAKAHEAYSKRIEAIEGARRQMLLQTGASTFDDLSSIAKTFAGEQSDIYKGLFLASKAFSIAQSLVAISTGVANALSLPFPANLAAAGTVAAAGANIVGTIQSTQIAGARQFGGPVGAGKMYKVGETGPETLMMGNNRYLIPPRDGKVQPMDNGGNKSANVTINNMGAPVEARVQQNGNDITIELVEAALADGIANRSGPVYNSLTANTNVTGRAL